MLSCSWPRDYMFYAWWCVNVMQSVPGCGTACLQKMNSYSTLSHRHSHGVCVLWTPLVISWYQKCAFRVNGKVPPLVCVILMEGIHIMWSSSGSQSKSWTSIIRQSPHNPRDLLYILSTDMEKAAALNSFFSECFNRNVPPIIPLDLNQLSAHLSGWLAFLLLPSCWNQ